MGDLGISHCFTVDGIAGAKKGFAGAWSSIPAWSYRSLVQLDACRYLGPWAGS